MRASVRVTVIILFSCLTLGGYSQKTKTPVKTIASVLEQTTETTQFYSCFKKEQITGSLLNEKSYTIFAPANNALDNATVQGAENWCGAFIAEGNFDLNTILEQVRANNWKAPIVTRNGSTITASVENGQVKLTDEKGNSTRIIKYNLQAANGIVHVIDRALQLK
ncbi:MAG: fasciclin domain-containing protein [Dinghuibacter sp.]|nr:fasciclin domain-containing protein [Dinghuibacter sp.]